tara:strand:+ start:100604 stop:101608 length:1005 start_codon:yes stop_codon:yes gene_type:complete
MSTQQTSSQVDEMDLTDIFALFKRSFYKFLALCFKAVDFIFKFWWVILILIIAGATLGYFTKGKPYYTSSLVIQTNFDSQPYVYNAIDQFNKNLGENDVAFMKAVGLDPANPGIGEVTIQPVIDVVGLMESMKVSERTLGTIIDELYIDDETELFASDRFYTNYKFHKLEVGLSGEESLKSIDALMGYINNQPFMQRLKQEVVKNLEDRIAKNEQTLLQIDDLIANYSKNADLANRTSSSLTYFNNQNNLNVNGTLTFKNELIVETEELKNDLITYTDAAVVVSDIQTATERKLKDKKEIIYPIILVFLFLLFAGIRYTYLSLRKEVEAQDLLD